MELQQRSYSCGPAALRAALYVLGHINIQEKTLRTLASTTPEDGTNEEGMRVAAEHYNVKVKELHTASIREARQWLRKNLAKERPVILCGSNWSHWVAAVGVLGKKVLVFDPARGKNRRKKYSGLRLYTEDELATYWCCQGEEFPYYALVLF